MSTSLSKVIMGVGAAALAAGLLVSVLSQRSVRGQLPPKARNPRFLLEAVPEERGTVLRVRLVNRSPKPLTVYDLRPRVSLFLKTTMGAGLKAPYRGHPMIGSGEWTVLPPGEALESRIELSDLVSAWESVKGRYRCRLSYYDAFPNGTAESFSGPPLISDVGEVHSEPLEITVGWIAAWARRIEKLGEP